MGAKIITAVGGLGNQMFCYAFYKKMCLEYPQINFLMDISDIWEKRYDRGAELLYAFTNIEIARATSSQILRAEHKFTFSYRGEGSRIIRKIIDLINGKYMNTHQKNCVTEEKFEAWHGKIPLQEWDNILFFDGYWQKIKYYTQYIEQLRNDFQFREIDDLQNIQFMDEIKKTDSVSIHIRRGDYVGETLDILDTSYYMEIIRNIQRRKPQCRFYIFSNDPEYVEKEYKWLKEKTIVKHNCEKESFRDMQLMSACKYNIIANSTFSLWAALLNDYPDRKIFYPSHYYKGIEMQDINLSGFVKINVNNQKD